MQASYEPTDMRAADRRAGQRLPLGHRPGRPGLRGGLPAAARAGLPRPRHVGEGGPEPAQQRAEVHLRRRHPRRRARRGRRRGRHGRRHRHRRPRTGDAPPVRAVPPHRERPLAAPTRAAASAWPWSRNSSSCTAAASPRRAPTGAGTTFTIRLPFGHAHLPADALVPAGHAATVSATADPFVQEALRWVPGTRDERRTHAQRPSRHARQRRGWPRGRSRRRVLVADDNADMRDYLARLLRTRRLPGHHGHRRAGRPRRGPGRTRPTW